MALQKTPQRLPWSNIRWLTALMGVILFIFGEFQLAGSGLEVAGSNVLGDWLNNSLHLGVPDINNVLFGLPVLIAGGLMLGVSLRGLPLFSYHLEEFVQDRPAAFRLIRSAWPWLLAGLALLSTLLIQLSGLNYGSYSILLWVTPLLLFAGAAAVWDRRRGIDLSPHISRSDLIWLLGLLTAGFLIGTYRLQGWPDQLMGDEGNFWTIARDIATGALTPSIFGNGVYSFPILSSFLQAGILKLFGLTLWGWRMASVLPGIITVVPLFLLARDAFNKRIAIAASIALLTSPYFLGFARLGYNNIQALFISVLALYWLYTGLIRSSHFNLFLAGAAAGFGFYTYFGARGSLFIVLAFITLLALTRKISWRQAFISLTLVVLAFLLVTAPYFVYGLHQDAETMGFKTFESVFFNVFNGRQFYPDSELFKYAPVIRLDGNDLFFSPSIYLALFSQGLIRTLLAFQKPWLITEHYIAFPLAGTLGAIFYLMGLALVITKLKQSRSQLLLVWFLTCIIGFSALNTVPPRHTHMVAIIPALAILIGLGVNAFTEALRHVHARLRNHSGLILGGLLAIMVVGGLVDYFVRAPAKYQPQPDQVMSWAVLDSHGEAFAYVFKDASEKDFKPYIATEFLQSTSFRTIPFGDVLRARPVALPHQKMVVFYPPDLSREVGQALRDQWGNAFVQRMFYSTNGTPVLAAGMNTPFTFERDRPLLGTFLDSFQHRPFIITLVLLLGLLGLAAWLPSPRRATLPGWLKRLGEWFTSPAGMEAVEESPTESLLVPEAPEAAPAQPPEWAEQLSFSASSKNVSRWASEMRSVMTSEGKDVYIRIHMPVLHLPLKWSTKDLQITIPPIHFPNGVLLILSVLLALTAQFSLSQHWTVPGIVLYLACAGGLVVWARRNPKWMTLFTGQLKLLPKAELLLAVLLFLAIAFTRFYDLGTRVYGLEADETKWTVQSWYSVILNVDRGEFATAHFQYLPVSFWVRSVFLRVFGMNFISARIESAFLSLLSAVFLYLLVRRLTSSPLMAGLSTALYSFSFVELSASHQALHNTTVEVWMMAGLFLLILALQERKMWQFQLAGIVLAAGMLTYETYFPTPLLAAGFLVGFGLFRIVRKKESPFTWLKQFLVFLWPVGLIFLIYIQKYIASQSYHFEYLTQAVGNGAPLSGLFQFVIKNGQDFLKTLFSQVVWTDSLINWPGPFLNPWLLPFVVIGLVYNLLNLRRPYFLFIPLWFLANLLYAPILVGSVWPRVLYTSLAPLVIWGALGLVTCLAALRTWFEGLRLRFAGPTFALLVAALLIRDYSIFTSRLLDPLDRQKRRELADLTSQSAAAVPQVLFPYETNQSDTVFDEAHVLLFSVAGARQTGLEASKYYQTVPYEHSLSALYQDRPLAGVDLIYDKTASTMLEARDAALQVILRCYPAAVRSHEGRFFDVYHFDWQALTQPECFQPPAPAVISPLNGEDISSSVSPVLAWDTHGIPATSAALTVERKVSNNYWIEVENTFAGPGWSLSSEFVNGFNGAGFLFDNWDAGAAQYALPVEKVGTYRIWIRSYKRAQNDQFNYIEVAGRRTQFASNAEPLNSWIWEDVGTYSLPAGSLPISLTRTYGNDSEYSVFIDTILVTPDLQNPPERISIWENVLDTGEIASASSRFVFSHPLPEGEYRWQVRLFEANRLVDSTGSRGVASPMATFIIGSQ